MQYIRPGLLVLLFAVCGQAKAQVEVQGTPEVGVFQSQYQNFQPGERVLARSSQDIQPTTRIPARLGTKFGIRYQLAGKRENEPPLTLMYLTPGVTGPDGQRHDKFEIQQKLVPGGADVMAFEFTEPYEMVPGEWHFLVFQGDRKLVEQRFEVR
jgi:hypothetical protein